MPEGEIRPQRPVQGLEELETLISQRAHLGERGDSARSDRGLSPPPEEFVGALLGERYRVSAQLGKGGTAAVYLAEDLTLGRQVALKLLSPDLARSDRWVQRFRREARAVARLEHTNIVKIYDYGETSAGLLYFVMEHVRGASLAQILSERAQEGKGGLPILHVRHIALQICRAIRFAHDERIIHRDLKPGNIMIVSQGDGVGLVKVLDFGIAKLAEDESDPGDTPSRLTGIGQTIGTPEYMAPEQVLGELLDHRSDVYALGCILYELLTGDVPFSAEPRERVRYKHVFEAPLPPRQRRADVPPALEAVCLRALEKSPERRFQTMAEMELALEREMEGDLDPQQVSASPSLASDGAGLSAPMPPRPQQERRRSQPSQAPRHTVLERSRPPVSSKRQEEAWFDALETPLPAPAAPPRDSMPSLEEPSIARATPAPLEAEPPEVEVPRAEHAVHIERATTRIEVAPRIEPLRREEATAEAEAPWAAGLDAPAPPAPAAEVVAVPPSLRSQPRPSLSELALDDLDEPTPTLRPRRRVLLWFALGGASALVVAALIIAQGGPVQEAQGRAEHRPQDPGQALSRGAPAPASSATAPTPAAAAERKPASTAAMSTAAPLSTAAERRPAQPAAAERGPAPTPLSAAVERGPAPTPLSAAAERKAAQPAAAAERKVPQPGAAERKPAPAASAERKPAPAATRPARRAADRGAAPRPAAPQAPEVELPLPSDVPLSAPSP